MTQKADPEDVIAWPCGVWCFRSELSQHSHKSDDYEVFYRGTPAYLDFFYKASHENN